MELNRMKPEPNKIYQGDCLEMMKAWPDAFVQSIVTSPPYWGLRDYGVAGQTGLEKTPEEYVAKMVEVFREARRILKDEGTLWLNLGDSYWNTNGFARADKEWQRKGRNDAPANDRKLPPHDFLKIKDLIGIPWRVAFALQADGWYLRSDIIWSKPNPMPESVADRPTKAHEYMFLLSKSERYFYDADAIKERSSYPNGPNSPQSIKSLYGQGFTREAKSLPDGQLNIRKARDKQRGHGRRHDGFNDRWDAMTKVEQCSETRNKRSVWTVATSPFPEAHFATFPQELITPCIMAGSRPGDVVLDPFMGAGTTALVAAKYDRRFLGVELNPAYVAMAQKRIASETAQIKMPL